MWRGEGKTHIHEAARVGQGSVVLELKVVLLSIQPSSGAALCTSRKQNLLILKQNRIEG
jgi:hypothetical protein